MTTIKLDEIRSGKRFEWKETVGPSSKLKSVIARHKPLSTFFIDGVQVNKRTFIAAFEQGEDRLLQLANKLVAAMESFKSLGVANLQTIDEIEAELTADERKIEEDLVTTFDFQIPEQDINNFLVRGSALAAMFNQCMTKKMVS